MGKTLLIVFIISLFFFVAWKIFNRQSPADTSISPVPTSRTGGNLKKDYSLIISAQSYEKVKDLLKAGDMVAVTAARNSPEISITTDRYNQAMNLINPITDSGLNKGIVFSSVSDLEKYINRLPPDIKNVAYNMEGGLTPENERNQVVESVSKFSALVKKTGRTVSFAPIVSLFESLDKKGKLSQVLSLIDSAGYQGQNVLVRNGMAEFTENIKDHSRTFKLANPDIKFILQFYLDNPTNTPVLVADAIKNTGSYVDTFIIYAARNINAVRDTLLLIRR